MPKIKTIEPKVLAILEQKPAARKDDWLLLKEYYNEIIDTSALSFATVCEHHNELGLPSFETLRRCRQKIQAKRLDLVDPTTAKHRRKLIDDFKDYAKEV